MNHKYQKYILISSFLGLLVLAAWIIKPFIIAILTSAVVAYIFYPVFKWINKKINHKFISAIIVIFIIVLVIAIPMIAVANVLSKEAYFIYLMGKNRLSGDILKGCSNYLCKIVKDWSSDVRVQYYIQEALKTVTEYILNGLSKFVLGIPKLAINLFISFFVIFFVFKDGDLLISKLKKIFKIEEREHLTINKRLDEVLYAVIYGNIVVALIQGAVGALSFWVFGVSSPIMWGIIIAIVSFAPYIGTPIIWIPASLIFIFDGVSGNNNLMIVKGIGLFLVNLVAGGAADNIIKPKIIGKRSSVHPFFILVGIFGGISLFGVAGFIIGPVILALAGTFIDLYITRNNS